MKEKSSSRKQEGRTQRSSSYSLKFWKWQLSPSSLNRNFSIQCGLEMAAATGEGPLITPLGFKGIHHRQHLFKDFVGGNQRRPRGRRLQGRQLRGRRPQDLHCFRGYCRGNDPRVGSPRGNHLLRRNGRAESGRMRPGRASQTGGRMPLWGTRPSLHW